MKVPAIPSWIFRTTLVVGLAFGGASLDAADEPAGTNAIPAADTVPPASALTAAAAAVTNAPVQIDLMPLLIEQLRQDMEASQARNAAALTASLSLIEPALSRLQLRQAEALQGANNKILIVACVFAGVSFLVLVGLILFLARTLGRFSELAVAGASVRRELRSGSAPAALEPGSPSAPDQAVAQASDRFQGALEQLQRRILELEHGLQGSTGEASRPKVTSGGHLHPAQGNGAAGMMANPSSIQSLPAPEPVAPAAGDSADPASRAAVLLGKGQTLLNLGDWKEALACFEQALTMTPHNAEAQVKKGLALEQLESWNEALESYNRAIEIDNTLTVAYLYKGAVCNRLQRYQEALASYELALHPERKSRAS